MNFAIVGVGGYIAPRHLEAIRSNGHQLVAALDPNDSVGILDRYFPDADFFTEPERFDRHLEKLRRKCAASAVDYVSICSPNYLHDAHIRMALRSHANAICEKPLVINPWNLDALAELEKEYQRRVYTVLQLRLNPALIELRDTLQQDGVDRLHDVELTYITRRGRWYNISWKGDVAKSGGIVMNIGVHFFDLLIWFFGQPQRTYVHLNDATRAAGVTELERARVRWFLSIDGRDLPPGYLEANQYAYRSMTVDGREVGLSDGFTDLHTRVYAETLAGRGFGIDDARPSIELVYGVRQAQITVPERDSAHPLVFRPVPGSS